MNQGSKSAEEDTVLRRSTRQRTKKGVVLDSGVKYSSDSELSRDSRESWLVEAVLGQEDRFRKSKVTMSQKEGDRGNRDSGRHSADPVSITEMMQMFMMDSRRRDEEARTRDRVAREREEARAEERASAAEEERRRIETERATRAEEDDRERGE